MNKNIIRIVPFMGEKKWCMWSGKCMAIYEIKRCNILIMGNVKTPEKDVDETKYKGLTYMMKLLNKMAYKKLIIYQ